MRLVVNGRHENRDHLGRCCKVAFPSKAKAAKFLKHAREWGVRRSYFCGECTAWHVTSSR